MLAHLIADYPLQPDRLVAAKQHLPGLSIHIAIHWVVMTLFTWPVRAIIWPYILTVAILHFGIDYFKAYMGRTRPDLVIGPYLLDQPLHWVSLIIVGIWMARSTSLPVWDVLSPWWIYGIGILIATYIWFITERVISYRDPTLQAWVVESMWPRMSARFMLYALLVAALPYTLLLALLVMGVITYLYHRYHYPRRWIFIDIAVALTATIIVQAILSLF